VGRWFTGGDVALSVVDGVVYSLVPGLGQFDLLTCVDRFFYDPSGAFSSHGPSAVDHAQ